VLTPDEDDVADGADKEVPPGTQFPEWWASESIILRGLAQAFLTEFPGSELDWRLLTQAFHKATTAPGGRGLRRCRMKLRQEWKELYSLAAALHKEGRYDEIVLWDEDRGSKQEGKKGKLKAALAGGQAKKMRAAAAATVDAGAAAPAHGNQREVHNKGGEVGGKAAEEEENIKATSPLLKRCGVDHRVLGPIPAVPNPGDQKVLFCNQKFVFLVLKVFFFFFRCISSKGDGHLARGHWYGLC
jgi:hypothetical protein